MTTSVSPAERVPRTVFVIFIYLVIDLLGFTVILPLLPSILDYYSRHDKNGLYPWLEGQIQSVQDFIGVPSNQNKVLFGGCIGSLYSFLQFLTAPMIGSLSDVYGRKLMLVITTCGIACSYAVWAISNNFTLFVISRIIGGVSKGNISLSTAVITDVCSSKIRGKGMARIGVAFSVGFIVGPLIGAQFAMANKESTEFYVMPALFALSLALLDILFLFTVFKESLPPEKRAHSIASSLSGAFSYVNPWSLFTFQPVQKLPLKDHQVLRQCGLVYFLYLLFYSGQEYSLSFLTHDRFQYTRMQQGKMYFVVGLVMASVQGGYVHRVQPGKEARVCLVGILMIIPSFILVGIAWSPYVLYSGLLLYAFSSGTVVPLLTTLVSRYGAPTQKGTILGIFRSLGALARAVGPMLSATVYWWAGPVACYCLGSCFFLIPLLILRNMHRTAGDVPLK
uniref:Putative tetracycline-efflux transporter pediculus us corporis tetracycline-efflux transporter n=1 Tax=Ixodes ricinus TaxID=34613 RepID=A0A0K8R469_IXORI